MRWLPPIMAGIIFGLIVIIIYNNRNSQPSSINFTLNLWLVVISILIVLFLAYLVVSRVMDLYEQREKLRNELLLSEKIADQAFTRFDAIFQAGRKFVEATNENEIIDLAMKLAVQQTGAHGASFIPLDEDGSPLSTITSGEVPEEILNSWLEQLASPSIRAACEFCEHHESVTENCPLLTGPVKNTSGIYCMSLNRGQHEFGILNLYILGGKSFDAEIQAFLGVLKHETSLALEGVRLRRRELAAFHQLQAIRQKNDLSSLLDNLMNAAHVAFEADFSFLKLNKESIHLTPSQVSLGEIPQELIPAIEGIIKNVIIAGETVKLGNVKVDYTGNQEIYSILSVPVTIPNQRSHGAVLIGRKGSENFSPHQLNLLEVIAAQISLVVQTLQIMNELEYQAVIEERKRLAREIHDGLAQTLGFLKLQAAQMRNYLTNEDYGRARRVLDIYYQTLNEAYDDVRQAIDGLRVTVQSESNLRIVLDQMLANFTDNTGIPASIRSFESDFEFQPEILTQIIRIIQETLSNIRKHAKSTLVWVECFETDDDFWLDVNDNGIGFSPEDVANPSRHGLRGIRERADLIGADFQIISQQGQGTTIRLRYPLKYGRKQAALV